MNTFGKPSSLLITLAIVSMVTLASIAHAQQERSGGFGDPNSAAATPAPVPAAPAPAATDAAKQQNHIHTHEDYLQAQRNMPTNPHTRNEYEEQDRKAGHRN